MRDRTRKMDEVTRQGKRRLYVFSSSRDDRVFQMQMEAISDRKCTLDEYDVEIDEVLENEADETELRHALHILPGQFKIVLIGKDAHIKLTADSCVSCEEVIMRIENEPKVMEVVS
jgi:hypothetical protein